MKQIDGRNYTEMIFYFEPATISIPHRVYVLAEKESKDDQQTPAEKVWDELDPGEPVTINVDALDDKGDQLKLKFSCKTLLQAVAR